MVSVKAVSEDRFFGQPLPVWKRTMDIAGASLGLVVFSPLFAIVALYIKLVSPGPVLFAQTRVGYLGQEFSMLKFRTMWFGADTEPHRLHLVSLIRSEGQGTRAPMAKLEADPRVIPFGQMLRKLCLDELPQLFNVLRGDMSLVGPRPSIPYEAQAYACWHRGRFDAVPGMTGLWQVSGKNRLSFREMICLDISYSRDLSLGLDLWILWRTVPAILGQFEDYSRREH